MNVKRFGTVLLHHWLLVGALTAVLVGAAAAVSYTETARYRATVLLQVQAPVDTSGAPSLQDILTARERAVTISDLGNTDLVGRRMAQTLGGAAPYACSFRQNGQSEFISAVCTSEVRSQVAHDADAAATALQSLLETQRQQRIAQLRSQYQEQLRELRAQGVPASSFPTQPVYPSYRELTVIDSAVTPATPYAPRPVRTMALALVLGLIVNCALAFLLEHLQNRARSTRELEHAIGAPVLGTIPTIARRAGRRRPELSGEHRRTDVTWESRVGARGQS